MEKKFVTEERDVVLCYPFLKCKILSADAEEESDHGEPNWESLGLPRPSKSFNEEELYFTFQYIRPDEISRIIVVNEDLCTLCFLDGNKLTIKTTEIELLNAILDYENELNEIEIEKSIAINYGSKEETDTKG